MEEDDEDQGYQPDQPEDSPAPPPPDDGGDNTPPPPDDEGDSAPAPEGMQPGTPPWMTAQEPAPGEDDEDEDPDYWRKQTGGDQYADANDKTRSDAGPQGDLKPGTPPWMQQGGAQGDLKPGTPPWAKDDNWQPNNAPTKDSSISGSILRGILRGAGGAGGAVLGTFAGGTLGSTLGPAGTFVGGIGGGIVGGVMGDKEYQALRDKMGLGDDPEQLAADEAQHPWAKAAGETIPYLGTMASGAVSGITRAAMTGIMGGVDALQQYMNKGTVDPVEAGIRGSVGLAGGFNQASTRAGESVAQTLARLVLERQQASSAVRQASSMFSAAGSEAAASSRGQAAGQLFEQARNEAANAGPSSGDAAGARAGQGTPNPNQPGRPDFDTGATANDNLVKADAQTTQEVPRNQGVAAEQAPAKGDPGQGQSTETVQDPNGPATIDTVGSNRDYGVNNARTASTDNTVPAQPQIDPAEQAALQTASAPKSPPRNPNDPGDIPDFLDRRSPEAKARDQAAQAEQARQQQADAAVKQAEDAAAQQRTQQTNMEAQQAQAARQAPPAANPGPNAAPPAEKPSNLENLRKHFDALNGGTGEPVNIGALAARSKQHPAKVAATLDKAVREGRAEFVRNDDGSVAIRFNPPQEGAVARPEPAGKPAPAEAIRSQEVPEGAAEAPKGARGKPQPKPLSGGATEDRANLFANQARETPKPGDLSGAGAPAANFATQQRLAAQSALGNPGSVAVAKSKLGQAWNAIRRPFNMYMNPEALTENTRMFGLNIRGSQAEQNRMRIMADENRAKFDEAVRKNTTAADRDEAARNFQTGMIPSTNPLGGKIGNDLYGEERAYEAFVRQHDPKHTWSDYSLPHLFEDKDGVADHITQLRDTQGTQKPITIGDIMNAGYQLHENNLHADGSVNLPRLIDNLRSQRDAHLESTRIAEKGLNDGYIFDTPRADLTKLDGLKLDGKELYADPNVAMMWDRYRPTAMDPAAKDIYTKFQRLKNAGTMMQLFGGTYHSLAETQEAMNGDMMNALAHAADREFGKAARTALGAPLAPWRRATTSASQAMAAYRKMASASPEAKDAMDDLVRGGFTPKLMERYNSDIMTSRRNLADAWDLKGMLKSADTTAIKQDVADRIGRVVNAYNNKGLTSAIGRSVDEGFKLAGEAIQTMMHPLFGVYIPRIKMGGAFETMLKWRDANPTLLGAKDADLRAEVAKNILKSADDRLGEMNQSTLFWNTAMRRGANMLFLSPSWETGTLRGGYGGLTDLIKNPKSMGFKSGMAYKPNASFLIALGITTAFANGVYRFMRTGELPNDVHDVLPFANIAPSEEPRKDAILPGYNKDFFADWKTFYGGDEDLGSALLGRVNNKLALAPGMVKDFTTNRTWPDIQIRNPSAPYDVQANEVGRYLGDKMKPIGLSQLENQKEAKDFSPLERGLGIKSAPRYPWEGQKLKNYEEQIKADQKRNKLDASKTGGQNQIPIEPLPPDLKAQQQQQNRQRSRNQNRQSGGQKKDIDWSQM